MRINVFDFSSAFNMTQPVTLRDKLEQASMDQKLIFWILDYLINHPDYVRTRDSLSDNWSRLVDSHNFVDGFKTRQVFLQSKLSHIATRTKGDCLQY